MGEKRERERDACPSEFKGVYCVGQRAIPTQDWENEEETLPDHEISKEGSKTRATNQKFAKHQGWVSRIRKECIHPAGMPVLLPSRKQW